MVALDGSWSRRLPFYSLDTCEGHVTGHYVESSQRAEGRGEEEDRESRGAEGRRKGGECRRGRGKRTRGLVHHFLWEVICVIVGILVTSSPVVLIR